MRLLGSEILKQRRIPLNRTGKRSLIQARHNRRHKQTEQTVYELFDQGIIGPKDCRTVNASQVANIDSQFGDNERGDVRRPGAKPAKYKCNQPENCAEKSVSSVVMKRQMPGEKAGILPDAENSLFKTQQAGVMQAREIIRASHRPGRY